MNGAIDQAYKDAHVDVPASEPGGRHEEGGKIFRNDNTGDPTVIRAKPGEKATVDLNFIPDKLAGSTKVGEFHIHPNPSTHPDENGVTWKAGPSTGDIQKADHPTVRVPSIIRADS